MRYILSLLLLCIIFENISSLTDFQLYKLGRFALALRKLKQHKEKEQRKLQEEESGDTSETELPSSNQTEPGEVNNASEPNKELPSDTPCSEKGHGIRDKKATIQTTYIFTFTIVETRMIYFGGLFFFYRRVITTTIIIRLRITYYIPYRALQDSERNADSVKATCSLIDENKNLKGQIYENGINVAYNCSAETVNGKDATKANIRINTDIDLLVKNDTTNEYEAISFNDINFNGNASYLADNIQDAKRNRPINLLDAEVLSKTDKSLRIQGTMEPLDSVKLNDIFNISVLNTDKNGNKSLQSYECKVTQLSPSILDCDISSPPFNASVYDLHLSSGNSNSGSGNSLIFNMKNWENSTDPIQSTSEQNTIKYRTNSSGLSGGAIAGIVIACVVVLAAASIAAILLRRPKAPLDNTTVVGLKTVDI